MTNQEDLQRRFAGPSSHLVATVLVGLAAVVLLTAVAVRPVRGLLEASRARRFLAEGERMFADKQFGLALQHAHSALQLAPNNPDILRFNARAFGLLRGETSLPLWRRLLDSGAATPEDRLAFVERALMLERADLVRDLATEIVAARPTTPRSDRIAALFNLQIGRLAEARDRARSAWRTDPANPTNALLLADLLTTTGDAAGFAEARPLFWSVAGTDPSLRLHALRRVSRNEHSTRADHEQLVAILSRQTNRTPAEDILLTEAAVFLDPSRTLVTVSNLVANAPRDDLQRFSATVDTLHRLGRHQEVLQLTAGGRERGTRELFLARHDSLAAVGQVEEAYRLTLGRGVPLPPFELESLRVRAAERTGDARRRNTHLNELIRAAGVHPARLRTAAQLAESLGEPTIAAEAWETVSQQTTETALALRQLQRLADQGGDTWTAREFARRALRQPEADPVLRLEIAYYDLLLHDDYDRALAESLRQQDANPGDFFARAVVALAHLRLGNPAAARAVLDRLAVTAEDVRPDALAVLAAVWGENNNPRRAREIAARLPIARLRPEERDLIRPWLTTNPVAGGSPTDPNR